MKLKDPPVDEASKKKFKVRGSSSSTTSGGDKTVDKIVKILRVVSI